METRSVSRCIAIAAHGKRCQQSPFRGSPYCWHHTQSRKVWPPSRLAGRPARPTGAQEAPADTGDAIPIDTAPELRGTAHALARALVDELDESTLAVLVDFLESDRSGALVLAREGGAVVIAHDGPTSSRRAATG